MFRPRRARALNYATIAFYLPLRKNLRQMTTETDLFFDRAVVHVGLAKTNIVKGRLRLWCAQHHREYLTISP